MERQNFFTSGWLFLIIAMLNFTVALIFGPLVAGNAGALDEWFAPLCMLIPMSIALAIVAIFVPRTHIKVKRILTVSFNALSAVLYMWALTAIISYWA